MITSLQPYFTIKSYADKAMEAFQKTTTYGNLPYSQFLMYLYKEGKSISNQPNLFLVEIHLLFFDVIAL